MANIRMNLSTRCLNLIELLGSHGVAIFIAGLDCNKATKFQTGI